MKHILLLCTLFVTGLAHAQQFRYQGTFEGIGDNREFFSRKAWAQTILGSRGSFEAGVDIDRHSLRGGISHFYEFGSTIDSQSPKLTLYYAWEDEVRTFRFGSFPRRNLIDFPLAMITDTLGYYRPNIEGLFGEVRWGWGKESGFVDWVSRQTDTDRENFMAGFSGEIFHQNIFLQNFFILYHDAGAKIAVPGNFLKDYLGYALQTGIRTEESSKIQGVLKAGILGSSFRERSITDGYLHAVSFFAEGNGRYKNYGIRSVLHAGEGHRFKTGDLFYRLNSYWRTDIIWYFINHKNVQGRFNLSFHLLEGKDLDQQQQLSIIYIFDN